jgi:hypothetical protein
MSLPLSASCLCTMHRKHNTYFKTAAKVYLVYRDYLYLLDTVVTNEPLKSYLLRKNDG